MEAKTIHRLQEVDPKTFGFRRREDNPLDCDLLVVDESSMVYVLLLQALLQALGVPLSAWDEQVAPRTGRSSSRRRWRGCRSGSRRAP